MSRQAVIRCVGTFGVFVAASAGKWATPVTPARGAPCDDPSTEPWVAQTVERVRTYDDLLAFAVARFGEPTECEGAVTSEFDGSHFGLVRFDFAGGQTFALETTPPAVSIVTLGAVRGFDDSEGVVEAVRQYAAGRGLSIDWDEPEPGSSDEGETEQFWDPDPGLNASVTLTRVDGRLVAVRVSMAP